MSTTQELRELLDAALQSLEIRESGPRARTLDTGSYRQHRLAVRQGHALDPNDVLGRVDFVITNEAANANLLHCLRRSLHDYVHEDRIHTALFDIYGGGVSPGGFEVRALAEKLLKLAVDLGSDRTAALFAESLAAPQCDFQLMALLGGIRIDEPIDVYDHVQLRPLPNSGLELQRDLPSMLQMWGMQRFSGTTLLVEDASASPRYMNPRDFRFGGDEPSDVSPVWERKSTNAPDFQPPEFSRALSMVARTCVLLSVQWRVVPEDEVMNLWNTGSSVHVGQIPDQRPRTTVTEPQVQEATDVYEALRGMSPDHRARLSVPIDRLIASWGGKGHVDQIIDLAIAHESLYSLQKERVTNHALGVRAARYLETNLRKRKELASHLRAFYAARNDAVHTGKIGDDYNVEGQPVKPGQLIDVARELCLRSIRQVLDGGLPDWRTLELE